MELTQPSATGSVPSLTEVSARIVAVNVEKTAVPLARASEIPGPARGNTMTKEYVQMVGRMAYLWGWPLVNSHNRRASFGKAPMLGLVGGIVPAAPLGQVAMLTGYVSPGQGFVTCPNQDVVYGAGYFALDKDPVVFQVPEFGDRFWVYALYDARTDEFSEIGKPYGTKPGFYLIVGPNWDGATPAGISAVVRSSTELGFAIPRIFLDDTPEDSKAIQPLINQVIFYPLSQFDGKMKTIDWSKLPHFPAPPAAGKGETKWVVPEAFFAELPQVMKEVPPLPGEESLYKWIGSVLDAATTSPAVMQTLVESAVAADVEIMGSFFHWRYNGGAIGNGWNSPMNNAQWGTDYLNRAATAKSNMYENTPNETKYIYRDLDGQGQQLDGRNLYTLTFRKGQTPPVRGFWSLTLYNELHLFEPNALKRYSLGTKNKDLKYGPDGSLTIYASATSPGVDKECNWLPAPTGAFSLYLRAYWPDKVIIDGTWIPPNVEKVAARTAIAPAEARAIAKEAYIYGFPLVDSYRVQYSYFADSKGPEFKGPWNQLINTPRVYTPADTAIQTPNSDTPYSFIGMDLRAEPIVLTVPAIEKERYFSVQLIDSYTFNFDYIGSRTTGNEGGSYLIAGPNWQGDAPKGVKKVIRAETEFVFALCRTQLFNPGDLGNVKKVQAGYKAQTLSTFLGTPAPQAAPAIDFIKPLAPEEEKHSLEFFNILSFVLKYCPTHPSEKALRSRFALIGIGAEGSFDAGALAPEVAKALEGGIADAWAELAGLVKEIDLGKVTAGQVFGTREYLKNNYLYRMVAAVKGIYGNTKQEAMYPVYAIDDAKQKLDGTHRYSMHFAPGQLPPVNAFWSLTMYELPASLLVANPINRYLINSPMLPELKRDEDGGLTLLIQNDSPGKDRETNWLPAPKGPFIMFMRLYWPTAEAVDGKWAPPPLARAQ